MGFLEIVSSFADLLSLLDAVELLASYIFGLLEGCSRAVLLLTLVVCVQGVLCVLARSADRCFLEWFVFFPSLG